MADFFTKRERELMSSSSIDDLLMGEKTAQHPETPENQYNDVPEEIDELESQGEPGELGEPEAHGDPGERRESDPPDDEETKEASESPQREYDEYGNEKERMSKGMKDRLDRKEKQHMREMEQRESEINVLRAQLAEQGASQHVQKAAKDFEYDPESQGDWQHQLAQFVRQEVASMNRDAQEKTSRAEEAQVQQEFEGKFRKGMSKFNDFTEVISNLPFEISNPMTLATRGMADPAAFLYAAAKRQPQELERISKLRDPYAQMTEIGKLEERMRKNNPTTKAPRPLSRTNEDAAIPNPKKKGDPTIEELIAKSDQKKLARVKGRTGGGRR